MENFNDILNVNYINGFQILKIDIENKIIHNRLGKNNYYNVLQNFPLVYKMGDSSDSDFKEAIDRLVLMILRLPMHIEDESKGIKLTPENEAKLKKEEYDKKASLLSQLETDHSSEFMSYDDLKDKFIKEFNEVKNESKKKASLSSKPKGNLLSKLTAIVKNKL